jgi:hypothetical protein
MRYEASFGERPRLFGWEIQDLLDLNKILPFFLKEKFYPKTNTHSE